MAKYSNEVVYNVKTTLDASGITKLQSELTKVQMVLDNLGASPGKMKSLGLNVNELQLYQTEIKKLQHSISECFNSRSGMLNLQKFNGQIRAGMLDIQALNGAFKTTGIEGKAAFNSMVTMMTNVNKQAVTANSTLGKIATTFGNTVRWGITSGILQEMMNSISGSIRYMKELDESLTQIQMVSRESASNMRDLAQYANKAAQNLATSTVDYTNAIKVFTQEGFNLQDSKLQAELSVKLANVSEQDTATTADQITAYRNAFGLSIEEMSQSLDKLANVANNTAANVGELMTAAQRSASVAAAVGATEDTFIASVSTIQSVTRQSAEEIGNGLKTIMQRFADIRTGKTTEDGADYGEYAQALKKVGVDVLDASGQFKGFDQIIRELQEVWGNLSDTMKVAVGEKVAGKFQYNRFAALMNNKDYFDKAYSATQNADGMMDMMQDTYAQSIEGRMKTLQTAGEQILSSLFNQDSIEPVLEDVTELLNGINKIVEVAGGGIPTFTALSALLLKAFSPQIAGQIERITTNFAIMSQASNNMKNMNEAMAIAGTMGKGIDSKTYSVASKGMKAVQGLDTAAQEKVAAMTQQMAEAEEKLIALDQERNEFASKLSDKFLRISGLTEEQKQIISDTVAILSEEGNLTQEELTNRLQQNEVTKDIASNVKMSNAEATKSNNIAKNISSATREIDANLTAANTAIKGFNSQQIAKGFTQSLSAVTSLAFGFMSLHSLYNILIDDTKSFEEKLESFAISGIMGLSMLASAFTSVRSAMSAFSLGLESVGGLTKVSAEYELAIAEEAVAKATNEKVAALARYRAATLQDNVAKTAATASAKANAKAEWEKAAATEASAIATRNNMKAEIELIGAEKASKSSKISGIVAQKIANAAKNEGTIANHIYAFSMKLLTFRTGEAIAATTTLAGTIAAVVAPIAAVAAIIGVTVFAYTSWQNAIHAANKKFEEQKEILQETQNNYKNICDEISRLKNAMDSLSDANDSVNKLTEGTKEWKEAVFELNQQVLSLIQEYPELAKYVSPIGGKLEISQEGLDSYYNKKTAAATRASNTMMVQQASTLQAKNNASIENFSNQWGFSKAYIREAIASGNMELVEGNGELNSAFAKLVGSTESNTNAIEALNTTVGSGNGYENYSRSADLVAEKNSARQGVLEDYRTVNFDDDGGQYYTYDFSTSRIRNNSDFRTELGSYFGKEISSIDDDSWSNGDITINFTDGSNSVRGLSSEKILEILTDQRAGEKTSADAKSANDAIYDAFGVKWDEKSQSYMKNEKTITSLQAAGASKNQVEALNAYDDDTALAEYYRKQYGTKESYAQAVARGKIDSNNYKQQQQAATYASSLSEEKFASFIEKSGLGDEGIKDINGFIAALTKGKVSLDQLAITAEYVDSKFNELTGDNSKLSNDQQAAVGNFKTALDDSSLSETAKLQLVASINENTSVENINAAIEAINDGAPLENIQAELEPSSDASFLTGKANWGRNIEEVSAYADKLQELAPLSEEIANGLEHDREAAVQVADATLRMNKGIEVLQKEMEGWQKSLKKENRLMPEYTANMTAAKEAVANLMNVDASDLSDDFIEAAIASGDLEEAINGNDEAMKRLQADLANRHIIEFGIDNSTLQTDLDGVGTTLQDFIDGSEYDVPIGTTLDDLGMTETFQALLNAGELTAEQLDQLLNDVHFDPDITEQEVLVTGTSKSDQEGMVHLAWMGADGTPQEGDFPVSHYGTVQTGQTITIPVINGRSSKKIAPKVSSGGNSSGRSSGGGGGGGGGKTKKKRTEEADKNKRDPFIEIKNAIDRQTASLEKQQELDNELYGTNKIKNLDRMIKSHQKLAELYQEEAKIQREQIEMQKNQDTDEYGNLTVKGLAGKVGMTVEYNEAGDIANGKAIQDALYAKYKAAYDEETYHSDEDDYSSYTENTKYWKDLYDQWVSGEKDFGDMLDNLDDINSNIRSSVDSMQETNNAIVEELHSMLEEWRKLSIEQHEFNQKMKEFDNGASLDNMFTPAAEAGKKIFDDILNWNGTGIDKDGNKVSISTQDTSSISSNMKALQGIDEMMKPFFEGGELLDSFKAERPDENGNYDWSKAQSIWAEGNITGIRDAILKGNSEEAQKIYDDVLESINNNNGLTTKQRQTELDKFNDYIDKLTEAAKQVQDINTKITYTSLTGGSMWTTMMDQAESTFEKAQDAFGYDKETGFSTDISDFEIDENGKLKFLDLTQQDAYDRLQDALQSGQDTIESLMDAIEKEEDVISDGIDKMADLIDRQIEAYENVTDRLDSISSINDLIYGESEIGLSNKIAIDDASIDALGGKLQTINAGIGANEKIIEKFQDIADANKKSLEELKTSNIISQAEAESLQAAQDNITGLQQEQMDTEAELLETIASRLETKATQEARSLANSLLGGDAQWMQEEWEMRQRNEELYLDDMNRAYNVQKLQYSYQQMLNDSANNNALIQQKIAAHMEDQLDYLQGKEKLSQTDIDYANARLAILQKQIALEDAQSNKTQMRLQRDASGNYSYVYTANEDDLAQKQQDLLDAQINAYNIAKEGLLEAERGTIDEIASMQDQIVSIMTDTSLSVEERKARIQEVMGYLGEYTEARTDQIKIYSLETLQSVAETEDYISDENASNLADIYDTLEYNLTTALGSIDDRFDLFATKTEQDLGSVENAATALSGSMVGLADATNNSFISTLEKFSDLVGSTSNAESFIGKTCAYLDQFKASSEKSMTYVGSQIDPLKENFNGLAGLINSCQTATQNLNKVSLSTLEGNLSKVVGQINAAISNLHGEDGKSGMRKALIEVKRDFQDFYTNAMKWLTELNAKIGETTAGIISIGDAIGDVNKTTEPVKNDSTPTQQQQEQQQKPVESWHLDYVGEIEYYGDNLWNLASRKLGNGNRYDELVYSDGSIPDPYRVYVGDEFYRWAWYNTGGYTGSWNDGMKDAKNGKLAVLHQKELVLNASDTENLLDIIKQVRQMQNINLSQNFDLSRIGSQVSHDTIEQRVEITAEFPGVTSSQEIETALLNLADIAYQSAHRNY